MFFILVHNSPIIQLHGGGISQEISHVYKIYSHLSYTVKPVLSSHSKIDKTKDLKTDGSLMKVESIAECCPWRVLEINFWSI